MKKGLTFSFLTATAIITAVTGTFIGLSIWANKPRGIHINLEDQ